MKELLNVFSHGTDGVCEYRIPVLLSSTQGTLIAACDARIDRPGDAPNNIDIVCKRSTDGGSSWSDFSVVVRYPGKDAASNPCGIVDRMTGKIWLFFTKKPDGIGKEVVGPGLTGRNTVTHHAVFSEDDGITWSEPRDITAMTKRPEWTKIAVGPGNGLQAADGRLMLAMNRNHGVEDNRDERDQSYLAWSSDHGYTWDIGSPAAYDTNEAQVAELSDGRLMLNCRSNRGRGCRAVCVSEDGGQSWGPIRDDLTLIEPVCQGSLIRSGDTLVFSNPASSIRGDRSKMTVRVSDDYGETWPRSLAVYAGTARYSCLTELPEGQIGLLFERDSFEWANGRQANACITFTSFSLSDAS